MKTISVPLQRLPFVVVAEEAVAEAEFFGVDVGEHRHGGMEVADAKRLKALEAGNAKLKKMLAGQMVDVATLKEMLGKNF